MKKLDNWKVFELRKCLEEEWNNLPEECIRKLSFLEHSLDAQREDQYILFNLFNFDVYVEYTHHVVKKICH